MDSHETLKAGEIRAILRLSRELRELRDPTLWRPHMARSLEALIGARAVLIGEVRQKSHLFVDDGVSAKPLHLVELGVDAGDRAPFIAAARAIHYSPAPLEALRPIYASDFTAARADLVEDARWDRSSLANELVRLSECDDFLISNATTRRPDVISSIKLFRAPGERRFSARDRLVLRLVHEDLSADWAERSGLPTLSPRQEEVLARLAKGDSEKQIASHLGLSTHTTHDHMKQLYRRFGVHSRGELFAKVAAHSARPRADLVVDRAAA